jgi:hypothetical protein
LQFVLSPPRIHPLVGKIAASEFQEMETLRHPQATSFGRLEFLFPAYPPTNP